MPIDLIEFPADDLARARQFWEGLLGLALGGRSAPEAQGLQSNGRPARVTGCRPGQIRTGIAAWYDRRRCYPQGEAANKEAGRDQGRTAIFRDAQGSR